MYLFKLCSVTGRLFSKTSGTSLSQLRINQWHHCIAGAGLRPVALTPFGEFPGNSRAACGNASNPLEHASEEHEADTFPMPLQTWNTLHQRLMQRLAVPPDPCVFKKQSNRFVCQLTLGWPEIRSFSGAGSKKVIAQRKACHQALLWLYTNNFIDNEGRPRLNDEAKLKNQIGIELNDVNLSEIDDVIEMYTKRVAPAISSNPIRLPENVDERKGYHPTLGIPFPSPEELEMCDKLPVECTTVSLSILPIDDYREKIVQTIKNNRVIIVKGETGCGKTTRVPQFILDDAIAEGRRSHCNIAVVQPRRITATETAKFVAKERGETLGTSIGYAVKMKTIFPTVAGGSILFVTGMKLAQKFTTNPSLEGVSHVVLDEVHLRDVGTDLVMTLLKQAMKINQNVRVIIMSATLDASVLQSYFKEFGHVPIVPVPGRTFPVKTFFLDDLPPVIVQAHKNSDNSSPVIDYSLVHRTISWINKTKPAGAILVFVSAWHDMLALQKLLSSEERIITVPVHSMFRDCSNAFKPASDGVRKVILATNIAETSLTFPDVVYVIDCGVHKKPQRNLMSPGGWSSHIMNSDWITKANVLQRKGRAGRVQPGESYHLFSKSIYESMKDYEFPGIYSECLELIVLNVKMANPDLKAEELLKLFPSPPFERDVRSAVRTLQAVSLLSPLDEKPTPLAAAVMKVSTSLPAALALIYSAIFRCFDSTLSVISCVEAPLAVKHQGDENSSKERALKSMYHQSSDHLAKAKALHDDRSQFTHSSYDQSIGLERYLSRQMKNISHHLARANLDEHASDELVLSLLLQSFGSLLVVKYTNSLNPVVMDKSGCQAVVKGRSVNHNNAQCSPSPFYLYLSGHLSKGILFLNETSIVSPLSVLLFLPSHFEVRDIESDNVEVFAWHNNGFRIIISKEHWNRVLQLRKALRDVQDYFLIAEVCCQPDENIDLLCEFRHKLLRCIRNVLDNNSRF